MVLSQRVPKKESFDKVISGELKYRGISLWFKDNFVRIQMKLDLKIEKLKSDLSVLILPFKTHSAPGYSFV